RFVGPGGADGRVFVLEPERRREPEQYGGKVVMPFSAAEWARDVAPLLEAEARLRGAPMRADADSFSARLGGEWRRWPFAEAFSKLVPSKVAAKMVTEPTPEALGQIVGGWRGRALRSRRRHVSWPLVAGLALVVTGVFLLVVAMRLPRASGNPLLVFATIFGACGVAVLLFWLFTVYGLRAIGSH